MATTVDIDLMNHLNANVSALTTSGTSRNLWSGKLRAAEGRIPQECVFVLATGGFPPQGYADTTSINLRMSGVQVFVRSNPRDFEGGQSLARKVRDALHHATIAGYIDVQAVQAEPIYIEEDEDGLHTWSVNFEATHEE